MVPTIKSFADLEEHLRHLDHARSRDFALGAEIGFGSSNANLILAEFVQAGIDNSTVRSPAIANGIEYGELLAERADRNFLQTARLSFRVRDQK